MPPWPLRSLGSEEGKGHTVAVRTRTKEKQPELVNCAERTVSPVAPRRQRGQAAGSECGPPAPLGSCAHMGSCTGPPRSGHAPCGLVTELRHPFRCWAYFLATVCGSTFVSLAHTLAAARTRIWSKCRAQRRADTGSCEPRKAGLTSGMAEAGRVAECIFDLQKEGQLFRLLRACLTCQQIAEQPEQPRIC